jgi:hypothetical protein
MQIQSEHDLRESQLLRDFHSESIPLHIQIQIQMGEMFFRTDRQEARSKTSETLRVFIHMRYERYSMIYYNDECSIYREHKVTIHERMRPLNNQ